MSYYARKSPRIPNFDYSSSNYYFITICTHNRRCIFGQPDALNNRGAIARNHILRIAEHYDGVRVDKYVIMPNHVHMILILSNEQNSDCRQIVAQYKSGVSREIHCDCPGSRIWQRSFHDHVIRNQAEYEKIWLYIEVNPQQWHKDCFYIDPDIGQM